MKVAIVGTSRYAEVYSSYLSECGWDIQGFLDEDVRKIGQVIVGLPVLGTTEQFSDLRNQGVDAVFAPIKNNGVRVDILRKARNAGLQTPSFLHSSAIVSRDVTIEGSVYILPGSIVMPYAALYDGVMISIGSNIGHHVHLKNGVTVDIGVNIGAGVIIDEMTTLECGSTVSTEVSIVGANVTIGAGAVVTGNISDGETVTGVSASVLYPNCVCQ